MGAAVSTLAQSSIDAAAVVKQVIELGKATERDYDANKWTAEQARDLAHHLKSISDAAESVAEAKSAEEKLTAVAQAVGAGVLAESSTMICGSSIEPSKSKRTTTCTADGCERQPCDKCSHQGRPSVACRVQDQRRRTAA